MSRRRDTVQERAHELLDEWAQGPREDPPEERTQERVDGGVATMSTPERYAQVQGRFESLDRSVRHVYRMSIDLGEALWRHYGERLDEQECAEKSGLAVRTWRDRLYTARAAFLSAYKMAGGDAREKATEDVAMEG